ncbi:hypothetical protein P3X46_028012 [Hevea brasiliensis]|uniref:Protein kinase domain-containing protein n=2 Tax=Hevea brasiliensis TaxID=3981 RepID=A0ABQ9KQP4_HEVBR|nr:hypothetical protein P3X46_028012 [Hevea brasiliensis]
MAFLIDKPLFLLLFLTVSSMHFVVCSGLTDSEILIKFKGSLSNASALDNWSDMTNPCKGDISNWNGVICHKGFVIGLQLEGMGLTGKIDVQTLIGLSVLRSLSFMNNGFDGPFPELKKLKSLRSIFLSKNHFSGAIPDDAFEGMFKLKKVLLAENEFTGAIPSSLAALPKLIVLRLEGNKFTGKLPKFSATNFASFNVSNNELDGPIPATFSKMDFKSFSGNKGLCGQPVNECNTPNTSTSISTTSNTSNSNSNSESTSKKPSMVCIIVVGIAMAVALAAIVVAALILLQSLKRTSEESIEAPPLPSDLKKKTRSKEADRSAQGSPSEHSSNGRKKADMAKLSFIRDDGERFDLSDLLKASAEILGSGCFGLSYKAALSTGPVMVVKRFKQMNNVGKEEFHEHMRRIGRLSHPNLLPLVAYYYRKEEKLLVTDYIEKGSLAVHLHGHQALGQPSMDWPTRLKIVKGVAKGLSYLSKELPSITAAHGHLKSSNILLNQSNEPLLTDYGLIPVINQENAQELMVAYKSPEYLQLGRITKKTDVWSLGILILELIIGKLPPNFLPQGKETEGEDLASWVNAIPQEQRKNQVIDKKISGIKNSEGEILKLLKIGMSCCEGEVEKRLDLKEAIERINKLKEKDSDEDFFSSYASEEDMKKGMCDDFAIS